MVHRFVAWGAILAGLGVAAGAFGAHGLKSILSPDRLAVYETAVRYHLYHALAMVVVGCLGDRCRADRVGIAGRLFMVGILLFSGSLYLLALSGVRWLGAITPLGGAAFLGGWATLAWAAMKRN
ncbi:MAG: DUF423 domain-containing protein [Nitrospira sp.]|nr:DUF423 domain-containing protein [Nitrospira sp.]